MIQELILAHHWLVHCASVDMMRGTFNVGPYARWIRAAEFECPEFRKWRANRIAGIRERWSR